MLNLKAEQWLDAFQETCFINCSWDIRCETKAYLAEWRSKKTSLNIKREKSRRKGERDYRKHTEIVSSLEYKLKA